PGRHADHAPARHPGGAAHRARRAAAPRARADDPPAAARGAPRAVGARRAWPGALRRGARRMVGPHPRRTQEDAMTAWNLNSPPDEIERLRARVRHLAVRLDGCGAGGVRWVAPS